MSFDVGKTLQCNHVDYDGTYWGTPEKLSGCPKCRGTSKYYDLAWDIGGGEALQVSTLDLLQELTLKATLTQVGSNKFHPNYGTSLVNSIANLSTVESVARTAELEIGRALGQLYLRQQEQLRMGQPMDVDELIYQVDKLDLKIVDERTLRIDVTITTEGGKETTVVI